MSPEMVEYFREMGFISVLTYSAPYHDQHKEKGVKPLLATPLPPSGSAPFGWQCLPLTLGGWERGTLWQGWKEKARKEEGGGRWDGRAGPRTCLATSFLPFPRVSLLPAQNLLKGMQTAPQINCSTFHSLAFHPARCCVLPSLPPSIPPPVQTGCRKTSPMRSEICHWDLLTSLLLTSGMSPLWALLLFLGNWEVWVSWR